MDAVNEWQLQERLTKPWFCSTDRPTLDGRRPSGQEIAERSSNPRPSQAKRIIDTGAGTFSSTYRVAWSLNHVQLCALE